MVGVAGILARSASRSHAVTWCETFQESTLRTGQVMCRHSRSCSDGLWGLWGLALHGLHWQMAACGTHEAASHARFELMCCVSELYGS